MPYLAVIAPRQLRNSLSLGYFTVEQTMLGQAEQHCFMLYPK